MVRKGQAALEYMFTYGYAFMAILITLGALLYFGIFDFSSLQSSECTFPPGIICSDHTIRPLGAGGEIVFQIRNTFGTEIEILEVNASSDTTSPIICSLTSNDPPNVAPFGNMNCPTVPATQENCWTEERVLEFECPIAGVEYVSSDFYDFIIGIRMVQSGMDYEHNLTGVITGTAQ